MGDRVPTRDDHEDGGQYDSDEEEDDDDYVPSGEGSDVSVDEDAEDEGDEDYEAGDGRKKRKAAGKKKRASAQPDDSDHNEDEKGDKPVEVDKQRADSLWADFLKDVDPPPKKTTATPSQTKVPTPSHSHETPSGSKCTKQATKKVTITKVYDFAGESVTVTKEVDRDSKEAKEFLAQKDRPKESAGSASEDSSSSKEAAQSSGPSAAASGVKRSGGVGSLVGQILKKKQKLNTLEKSKLDWDVFKQKEGIDEELKRHNLGKDGYLERQAFLERTDLRQFELEKTLRMKSRTSNR